MVLNNLSNTDVLGRPNYQSSYEEANVMATVEIEGGNLIPMDIPTLPVHF